MSSQLTNRLLDIDFESLDRFEGVDPVLEELSEEESLHGDTNESEILTKPPEERTEKELDQLQKFTSRDIIFKYRPGAHRELLKVATCVHFLEGEGIFNEGQVATGMYLVIEGSVGIIDKESSIHKPSALKHPREGFGYDCILEERPYRDHTAIALTEVILLQIDKLSWEQVIKEQHQERLPRFNLFFRENVPMFSVSVIGLLTIVLHSHPFTCHHLVLEPTSAGGNV
jgi:hypothetical protein